MLRVLRKARKGLKKAIRELGGNRQLRKALKNLDKTIKKESACTKQEGSGK
jgi:hypothetical protein